MYELRSQTNLIQTLALHLTSYVTLEKLLKHLYLFTLCKIGKLHHKRDHYLKYLQSNGKRVHIKDDKKIMTMHNLHY